LRREVEMLYSRRTPNVILASMGSILVKHAEVLVTMYSSRRELKDAGIFAVDGIIKEVGSTAELPQSSDTVLDLSG
jgi:8-oxoguanine deaminase